MPADVTGTLTVVMMGLGTMMAIVGGYLLLSTAVNTAARGSAYNTFTRLTDTISTSMAAGPGGEGGATNMYLTPHYVLFSASFSSKLDVPYYIFDGQRMNHIVVNQNNKDLFEQVRKSSSGLHTWNNDSKSRNELKKCEQDTCLCLGEMTTYLMLEPEYFKASACVDICWGENPGEYDDCLKNNKDDYATPREVLAYCNKDVANDNNPLCQDCWDYVQDYDLNKDSSDKLRLIEGDGYNVLTINVDSLDAANAVNHPKLMEFSEAVKFSFIPNIIECKTMSEIATSAGRGSYCSVSNGANPYLFNYIEDEGDRGIFGILSTSKETSDGVMNNNLMFDLFNVKYEQDNTIEPDTCYSYNSYVKTEVEE